MWVSLAVTKQITKLHISTTCFHQPIAKTLIGGLYFSNMKRVLFSIFFLLIRVHFIVRRRRRRRRNLLNYSIIGFSWKLLILLGPNSNTIMTRLSSFGPRTKTFSPMGVILIQNFQPVMIFCPFWQFLALINFLSDPENLFLNWQSPFSKIIFVVHQSLASIWILNCRPLGPFEGTTLMWRSQLVQKLQPLLCSVMKSDPRM